MQANTPQKLSPHQVLQTRSQRSKTSSLKAKRTLQLQFSLWTILFSPLSSHLLTQVFLMLLLTVLQMLFHHQQQQTLKAITKASAQALLHTSLKTDLPRVKAFTFMRAIHLQLQPFVTMASQSISPVNLHSTARLSPRIRNGQKKILKLSHIQAQ